MCFEGIWLPRSTLKTTELWSAGPSLAELLCYSTEFGISFGQAIKATKGSMSAWLQTKDNQKYTSDTENMPEGTVNVWGEEARLLLKSSRFAKKQGPTLIAGKSGWNSLPGQGIVVSLYHGLYSNRNWRRKCWDAQWRPLSLAPLSWGTQVSKGCRWIEWSDGKGAHVDSTDFQEWGFMRNLISWFPVL